MKYPGGAMDKEAIELCNDNIHWMLARLDAVRRTLVWYRVNKRSGQLEAKCLDTDLIQMMNDSLDGLQTKLRERLGTKAWETICKEADGIFDNL